MERLTNIIKEDSENFFPLATNVSLVTEKNKKKKKQATMKLPIGKIFATGGAFHESELPKGHIMTKEELERIIQEEIAQYQQRKIYGIQDLADFVTQNISTDQEIKDIYAPIHLQVLQDAFREGGDYGVVEAFKSMWGSDIYPIGRGRYCFEKLY